MSQLDSYIWIELFKLINKVFIVIIMKIFLCFCRRKILQSFILEKSLSMHVVRRENETK